MKTDLYTKIVLTVIAVFLGVLIFQNTSVISSVQANTAATVPTPIPTVTQNDVVDVRIVGVSGELPVKMGDPYSYSYRPLSVIVEKWSAGDLPVTITGNR